MKIKIKLYTEFEIGYFEKDLSSNIFEGLNVLSVKKGSGTFYLIGSLQNTKKFIKLSEMKSLEDLKMRSLLLIKMEKE